MPVLFYFNSRQLLIVAEETFAVDEAEVVDHLAIAVIDKIVMEVFEEEAAAVLVLEIALVEVKLYLRKLLLHEINLFIFKDDDNGDGEPKRDYSERRQKNGDDDDTEKSIHLSN